jgi:uncharacterized damage-inducible protein DinB
MINRTTARRRFLQSFSLGAAALTVGGVPSALARPASARARQLRDFASDFLPTWERAGTFTLAYAEAMPADKYDFRPTPEVRTFAEQLLHIAGSNAFFGNLVSKLPQPEVDLKGATTKAEIMSAVGAVFGYCAECIRAMPTAEVEEPINLFDQNFTKDQVVLLMRDHVTHHRGQTVIYLRLNGIVPPQYVGN